MHDIEPYFRWREHYIASEDERSPFYGRVYSEFTFSNKIYNYFIHPQWDEFGSNTLYLKILFVDYEEGYCIIELIGEWNDAISNDIMFLKREIVDHLFQHDIHKYIIVCENVLNFHGSDDCYYEEWKEEVIDEQGWVCFVNTLDHVKEEMEGTLIQHQVHLGGPFNELDWRGKKPQVLYQMVSLLAENGVVGLM